MSFSLGKLFRDVFAPQVGDVVTIMYDRPHDGIQDTPEWRERREMAEEWQQEMLHFANKYGMQVNPVVTYEATGVHNGVLPDHGLQGGQTVRLQDVAQNATIIISMPQFSATAPLVAFTKENENLRVASLPLVSRAMQETGLSADYSKIASTCAQLAPFFEQADGIEVTFSTGDVCYFDISDHRVLLQDNGLLPPGTGQAAFRVRNLPSGEVLAVPNESPSSNTHGTIPVRYGSELAVFVVEHNQIVDVRGDGPLAAQKRDEFRNEKATRNIAEVAIGCNDKAVVTGNVLEDEKAGFHWAYGRSDQFGGTVGPKDFSDPSKVVHWDTVYAKGNPVVCQRLDFVRSDGTRQTVIRDGVLSP